MRRSWIVGSSGARDADVRGDRGSCGGREVPADAVRDQQRGTLRWVTTANDSPTDANQRALKLVLPPNAPGCSDQNLAACSFGRAFSRASNNSRTPVGDQMNLSWDFAAANPVTASERMNVFFSNGDVAFLNSLLCTHPIASSGGTWLRSDFTGFKSNCEIDVVGETGGTYARGRHALGVAVYAAQWPDQVVTIRHLLVDSGAAPAHRGEHVPTSIASPSGPARCTPAARRGRSAARPRTSASPRAAQATVTTPRGPRAGALSLPGTVPRCRIPTPPIVYRWSTSSNPNPER